MKQHTWDTQFAELFDRCLARYHSGDRDFRSYYSADDSAFLDSIGYKPREFFDFVEDLADMGAPSRESAILIAAVRRDYLRVIQEGKPSDVVVAGNDLPARDEELGGIPWLPRILVKARAKLRGELDPDVMYSCGGDRAFLSRHDLHPADFLRAVWAAGDDDSKVLAFVNAEA